MSGYAIYMIVCMTIVTFLLLYRMPKSGIFQETDSKLIIICAVLAALLLSPILVPIRVIRKVLS